MKKTFALWRYLCAVLLTVTFGVSQMWGESVTVGLTTALSTTSGQGGSEVYSNASNTHLTVTRAAGTIGTGQDTVIANTSGTQAVKMASNTNQYAAYLYNIKKSMTGFSSVRYAGYSVSVADGYKYSLTALNASLAGTANFTWKVEVINSTGTVLYTTGNKTITNYNSTSATNYSIASNLSSTSTVQDLTGTFYVRAYFYIGSTSKYLCFPTLTITGDLESKTPAATYTVTIDPNGGSYASTPDGWTYDDENNVYTKSIAEGTSFTAPSGLTNSDKDLSWKDGSDNVVTFPVNISGNITFIAQWADHVVSTDATLSALSLAGYTLNETFAPATKDYTATLPFYASAPATSAVTATANDANASVGNATYDSENHKYSVTVTAEDNKTTATYTITLNWEATPTASSSINIEQWVLDNQKGKDDAAGILLAKDLFDAHNIGYVNPHALDSLNDDPSKTNRNEAYLGAKIKAADSQIKVILPAANYLKVKFGNRGATVRVSINGGSPADAAITENVYTLPASSAVREVVFSISKASTVVFKQIMVNAEIETVTLPWRVTYDAGLGECATAEAVWFGTALVLPDISTLPSGKQFDGWYDAETSGTKIGDAGDTYTPEGNITLYAYYSPATALDNTDASVKAVKFFRDGMLLIEKNGKIYNAQGQVVR